MRAPAILRACTCAVVALGLSTAAAIAETSASAGKRSVVIATPGEHGVVLVGANHQARKVMLRHRSAKIRPGAVVRYSHHARKAKGKSNATPVETVSGLDRVGHVKRASVYGVVAKGHKVRLADGTKLRGTAVKSGVAALTPGVLVAVSLSFDSGKSRVQAVKPKRKAKGKPKKVVPAPTPVPETAAPAQPAGPWWTPSSSAPMPMQWLLDGPLSVGDPVQMGLRDLNGATLPEPAVYDLDGETTSKATVDALHATGKKVICYVDAGTYETGRSDASKFQAVSPQIWGSAVAGWPGEYWLDVSRVNDLAPIMQARFQECKAKGFDGIEPDNIDGWSNSTGFSISSAHQIAYNRALAAWAHALGLSIGLKNDLEQVPDLVGNFDWALDEECYAFNECSSLKAFAQAGKAVWIAEYATTTSWDAVCADSLANHFNTARYKLALNAGREPCTGTW
jgi:hypothetical protein